MSRGPITRDEFELWRAHPVTKWVMRALENAREQERAEWMRISWEAAPADGHTSPTALIELRTRFDTMGEVTGYTFEEWSNMHAG